MSLESATFISGLVAQNPTSNDNVGDGDNHIRMIKNVLKTTFPAFTGAVTPTHAEVNSGIALANTATDISTANSIVRRSAAGNFSANSINASNITTGNITITGTVTGSLSGNANTATNASSAAQAARWTTSRLLSVNGDVNGSVSINGSQDVTLTATVSDNSHNHTIANVTGLTTELTRIESTVSGSAVASAGKLTNEVTIALTGDVQGGVRFDGSQNVIMTTVVADNSHNHTISNVTGLQGALNAKLETTGNAASASKLQTARNVQISGAVTGTVAFDGAADVNLVASSNISVSDVSGLTAAIAAATLAAWPVGSIMSTTTSVAPSFGGNWVAFGAGRVQIGQTSLDSDFATVGGASSSGGSKTATLAVTNLPAHSHNFQRENPAGTGFSPGSGNGASSEYTSSTATTGDGTPFSILPPYVVVYMWRRIS